jgi:rhodanese-related sulfurtransferase
VLENVSVHDLAAAIERGDPVVDVRNPDEYASGHVPTAVLMPMHTVPARVDELRSETPVYVICAVGARSYQVGEFLAAHGIPSRNVVGGTTEWASAGYPLSFD